MRDEVLIKAPVGSHGNLDLGKQKSRGEMFARGWKEKSGGKLREEAPGPRPKQPGRTLPCCVFL